jgi:hypothetical protein
VVVQTIALDDFFRDLGWPAVQLVKVDVEGAEPLVLRGMVELCKRSPLLKCILEFAPSALRAGGFQPDEVLGLLRDPLGLDHIAVLEDDGGLVPLQPDSKHLRGYCAFRRGMNILAERGELAHSPSEGRGPKVTCDHMRR